MGSADTSGNAYAVSIQGGYAYVAIQGNYAYVAAEGSGLQVVDITTPAAPVIVGGVQTSYSYSRAVAVTSTGVCLADDLNGMTIVPRQCGDAGGS